MSGCYTSPRSPSLGILYRRGPCPPACPVNIAQSPPLLLVLLLLLRPLQAIHHAVVTAEGAASPEPDGVPDGGLLTWVALVHWGGGGE